MTKINYFQQKIKQIKETITTSGRTKHRIDKLFMAERKLKLAKSKRIK